MSNASSDDSDPDAPQAAKAKPAAKQPAPAKLPPWGPLGATGVAVLLFVGAQFVASLPFILYPFFRHLNAVQINDWVASTPVQFAYGVIASAATLGGLWWFLRLRGMGFGDIGWGKFHAKYILYALAGFGFYFLSYALLRALAVALVPSFDANQQQDIGFNQAYGVVPLAATFVALVVLPPLVEETLFRGFLYTAFRRKWGLWISAACVSVLFALPHLLGSEAGAGLLWIGAVDTFALSMVLCYLREKTGNLWTSMGVHALKNGIAFLAVFVLHLQ